MPDEVCMNSETTSYKEQQRFRKQLIEVCILVSKEECSTVIDPHFVIPHHVCQGKSKEECHQKLRVELECTQEPEDKYPARSLEETGERRGNRECHGPII